MKFSKQELLALKPKEKLLPSQWSEQKRVLTNAAIKGPYQCDMVPCLVPVMDRAANPDTETIVLCKSAQIGGTDAMLNIIGYFIDQDPSSIMLVLADEDTAIEEMSRRRVKPMFAESPGLSVLPDKDQWTKKELGFMNGARLTFGWASSVERLASRPFRIVCCDEIDKSGYNVSSKEGDSIGLAKERTNTFANRLILLLSTPTVETGRITKELESCDVIYDWHVPCPECGQLQPLRWSLKYATGFQDGKYRARDGTYRSIGGVVWEGGRKATTAQIEAARYACGECGCLWTSVQKNQAIQKGEMVSREEPPEKPRKVGFHLNRLYSLFPGGRLENLVAEWTDAVKSGEMKQIQGFVNSSLADCFKQVTAERSESEILLARTELPERTVPQEAVALTCGIDNQKYGFWYSVRAWAPGYTSWLIDYGFLATWADVDALLFETLYPRDGGGQPLTIWRAGIDTGGTTVDGGMSMTEEVYWYVRKNGMGRGCRLYCTKGASNPQPGKVKAGKPLDRTPSGKPIPGGLQIITLDTDKLKDVYHYRLQQAIDGGNPQAAYLHATTGEDYAEQIRSEEKRVNDKGFESWVHVRGGNHLLDCEVINHALVDPEWPGGGLNLYRPPQKKNKKSSKKAPRPATPAASLANPYAR